MEMNPREKKLLMVLGVIALLVGIDFALNSDDYLGFYGHLEKPSATEVIKSRVMTEEKKEVSKKVLASITDWGRDPFRNKVIKPIRKRKGVRKAAPAIKLELKAISIAQNLTVAMINSKIVTTGDEIEGFFVKEITSKQVVLEKAGVQKTLKLP